MKLLPQFAKCTTQHIGGNDIGRCFRVGVGRRGYISTAMRASLNNLYTHAIHSYLQVWWRSSTLGTSIANKK